MTTELTVATRCDGCGKAIDAEMVLPPVFLDENRNEVHFCDHLCLIPYAKRRHEARVAAVTKHLEGNVRDWKFNKVLPDKDPELDKKLAQAEAALAKHVTNARRA